MRLTFKDWKVEDGEVLVRRAEFGPLVFIVHLSGGQWYGAGASLGSPGHKTYAEAEEACEAHLQAILDAAKEVNADLHRRAVIGLLVERTMEAHPKHGGVTFWRNPRMEVCVNVSVDAEPSPETLGLAFRPLPAVFGTSPVEAAEAALAASETSDPAPKPIAPQQDFTEWTEVTEPPADFDMEKYEAQWWTYQDKMWRDYGPGRPLPCWEVQVIRRRIRLRREVRA